MPPNHQTPSLPHHAITRKNLRAALLPLYHATNNEKKPNAATILVLAETARKPPPSNPKEPP